MWVLVLGSKGEGVNAIRHAQAAAEAKYSVSYNPQQNGIVEGRN
jgi:hypothetical protein